jgi:transposase
MRFSLFKQLPKAKHMLLCIKRNQCRLNQCRRLSKDYEELPTTSETFVYVAMTRLMRKRLAA